VNARREAATGDERGFTVVELSIVMAVALIVMASLLGLLVSQSNASVRIEKFVDNQERTRLILVALQRDLRSAESIVPVPPPADAAYRIDLHVFESPESTEATTVRWRITDDGNLVREVVSEHSVALTLSLAGVSNAARGVPLLTYFGPNSDTPHASGASASTIANCTVRVGIDLLAAPEPGPAAVHLVSDVQIRNRILEGTPC
jgi:prepilin-type N-terminal cleavage/methylation domain-containing protein